MNSTVISSNVVVLEPAGEINAANAKSLKQQLLTAVNELGEGTLLIDMKRVGFLDSAGLMAFVSALRLAQDLGRRLILCEIDPSIRILFELTQLDKVFEIFENRNDFYTSLS